MVRVLEDTRSIASAQAVQSGELGASVLPATGRFAILTCMDSSVDSAKLLGLPGSQAHVIRNAGARASEDAIRSLLLADAVFGASTWFVVHHSHCGLALLSEEITEKLWADRDVASRPDGFTPADRQGLGVEPLLGKLALSDELQLVAADVARIRKHPRVSRNIVVRGYVYRPETGTFHEVASGD